MCATTTRRHGSRAAPLVAAALAAAALATAIPAPAMAGTAFLSGPSTNAPGGLRFTGGNEQNRVHIGVEPTGVFRVADDRNRVNAIAPCQSFNEAPTRALCPPTRDGVAVTSFDLRLGGGDDSFFNDDFLTPLVTGYVEGGSGNDVLNTGSAPTDDRLFGEAGDDSLFSSGGADVLRGGDGNDTIFAVDAAASRGADRIICDAGFDRATIDLLDVIVFPTCESVARAAIDQHPLVRIKGRSARVRDGEAELRLACPRKATSDCDGNLTVSRIDGKRRVRLGSSRYEIDRGERDAVAVAVGGLGRTVPAEAEARERDPEGMPKITTQRLELR